MDEMDYLVSVSQYIKGRLYFATLRTSNGFIPQQTPNTHYFTIDDLFVYENFYSDFGPLNLAMVYRYCIMLDEKLKNSELAKKRIIHYTSNNSRKRVNAAFLIASYSIIYMNKTPAEAYWPLVGGSNTSFISFRDASFGPSQYTISLMDCLEAIFKAFTNGFFNFEDFDVKEYEHYERVEYGDLNWIIPQKFIAFCGPHAKTKIENGYPLHAPETYVNYFRVNNVTTVVRLNKKIYDSARFTAAGFRHCDLFFIDGSTPNDRILNDFLEIAESTPGAVAVHCKAGLGRTGSLIGCYLMKHYTFTALETIAWIRLCRPGSIIGHQQQWLEDKQHKMWYERDICRALPSYQKPHHTYGIYSIQMKLDLGIKLEDAEKVKKQKMQDVSKILQKVDTMKLEDLEDENKNKEEAKSEKDCEPRRITQGDKLNQIKARRHPRSLTTVSSIISDDSRPHTRAKSQPLRTTLISSQPQPSPTKVTTIITNVNKEKESLVNPTAKRAARLTTATTKSARTTSSRIYKSSFIR